MASGWATGVSLGLVNSINNDIAAQKKTEQEERLAGDEAQLSLFKQSAAEYDKQKQDVAERKFKIKSNAEAIANGPATPEALALAWQWDQSTKGADLNDKDLDRLQQSHDHMLANPDSVKHRAPDTTPPSGPNVPSSLNPQTMQRFGVGQDALNQTYGSSPNTDAPNDIVPSGVTINQQKQNEIMDKLRTEASPEALDLQKKITAGKANATASAAAESQGYTMDNGEWVPKQNPLQGPAAGQATSAPSDMQSPASSSPQSAAEGNSQMVSAADLMGPQNQGGQQPPQQGQQQQPPAPTAPRQAAFMPPDGASPGISLNSPPPQDNSLQSQAGPASANTQQVGGPNALRPMTPQETQQRNAFLTQYPQASDSYMKPLEDSGMLNSRVMQHLTPIDQTYVRSVTLGLRPDPGSAYGMARGSPYSQMLTKAVSDYDPSYYSDRAKDRNAFLNINGATGKQIYQMNTTFAHIGLLEQAVIAQNNGDIRRLNTIANTLGVETGKSVPAVFGAIHNLVNQEMMSTYRGGAATLSEIQHAGSQADISSSLEQQLGQTRANPRALLPDNNKPGVLNTYVNALLDRKSGLDSAYHNIMGNTWRPYNFFTPEAQKVVDSLRTDSAADSSNPHQGLGKTLPVFTDPNDPEFQKLQPGAKFMVPGETVARTKH